MWNLVASINTGLKVEETEPKKAFNKLEKCKISNK